jgi:hypothetical protein
VEISMVGSRFTTRFYNFSRVFILLLYEKQKKIIILMENIVKNRTAVPNKVEMEIK